MQTIHQSIDELRSALRDYIEATYHISAKSLIAGRKALLDHPGVIHQVPYLESTPRYETGESFADMPGLDPSALEAFLAVAQEQDGLARLVHDPPYQHQSQAVRGSLIDGSNLIIMTGTGSGKTESFLLPILGKLAREANRSPDTFVGQPAMRALVLYPMNALVNDQLGRLRALFGDPRLVALFKGWAARPPRFARYTSRTPYAGVRTAKKDSQKFKAFERFYVDTERRARDPNSEKHANAKRLMQALKRRGKWPGKPDLAAWLGEKGTRWQDGRTGAFVRAVTLADDTELLTRHEVQTTPPDLLVTNYSMLEYMLMRPVERPIFEMTRTFLEANPDEKFLVVLDEAHLYRGAAGAEVGLLLRRLRDRLGIDEARFQVICATASFNEHTRAPQFGAQLSGLPADTFVPITGSLALRARDDVGSTQDANVLAGVDLQTYRRPATDAERLLTIRDLLDYRGIPVAGAPPLALFRALADFGPMCRLINTTMEQAVPVAELGKQLFPSADPSTADAALTALMTLGSAAREDPDSPGLLPCRIHNFFRGLPGLWVCMDPNCDQLAAEDQDGICGRMYGQPRQFCDCGARALELYTCRNCGTAYARAYTNDVDLPSALWAEPGASLRVADGETSPLVALDLLLEVPALPELAEPADYDLETGRLNTPRLGPRTRRVHLRGDRISDSTDDDADSTIELDSRGHFVPCAGCGEKARFGRSYIQDHQTKGDQPFQTLVAKQLQIQSPSPIDATPFAPLQGRKVLAFSDSRQVAARLAPNLQMYSVRDSLRPLIVRGYRRLQGVARIRPNLSLEDLYLAILLASKELNVRLRPETKSHESTSAAESLVSNAITAGEIDHEAGLLSLCMDIRNERPPQALLEQIVTTVRDRFLGFEALALASIAERDKHTAALNRLPPIPGLPDTPDAKAELARAWLRCWQRHGFWLSHMPGEWWRGPRSQPASVRGQPGKFRAIETVLADRAARDVFWKEWSPELLRLFTDEMESRYRRLRGSELTLLFDGSWMHCSSCKSVHRPVSGIARCLDCGSADLRNLEPDTDPIYLARKGFYRKPVMEALATPPRQPLALVAAEHTAQLNAPQDEDVFSKAEENELLFQDVALSLSDPKATAIDVLSSTTTMEVGIDIGALSGVALRNMPPSRANYQQRSGRAGRRGNAVATVVAFGSVDSHDEHYFAEPDEMIRGNVVDPVLTLDNREIVRRHVRAFLLQSYLHDRIPDFDPDRRHDLFSVLGTVSGFRDGSTVPNREDFAVWLRANAEALRSRVSAWIPSELAKRDRETLLDELTEDCLKAINDAIQPGVAGLGSSERGDAPEVAPEEGEERAAGASATDKLLDRLLYCGKLPRYAFPTDVATFHVFDPNLSTRFRPIMRFAPQQGLSVALTQYAPGKQVWISGKCYTSRAIFSVNPDDRYQAWQNRRVYLECSDCGFARTYPAGEAQRGETRDCQACSGKQTFGPGRNWLRPPGFAHPVNEPEVTSPDDMPETSYATRAKLTMNTPGEGAHWSSINDRIRVLRSRQHLLVSNSGPLRDGYTYCTKCGSIEASAKPEQKLFQPHPKPFPSDEDERTCDGIGVSRHVVLGTDFITDIALFSMRVAPPLSLKPGHSPTAVALRTVSEALAKAACHLLDLEPGELMAEFRPALTGPGSAGREAEVFLYDTLPGGAGFSTRAAECGPDLFHAALSLLNNCPEQCDASCYRCLRSFKNKFEHVLLDRHVGAQLLEYLLSGEVPGFSTTRLRSSTALLYSDMERQGIEDLNLSTNVPVAVNGVTFTAPIFAQLTRGRQFAVSLSAPLSPNHPAEPSLAAGLPDASVFPVILANELVVRNNLASATRRVLARLR